MLSSSLIWRLTSYRTLRIWTLDDPHRQKQVIKARTKQGRRNPVNSCCFTRDGQYFAGACKVGNARLSALASSLTKLCVFQDGSIHLWKSKGPYVSIPNNLNHQVISSSVLLKAPVILQSPNSLTYELLIELYPENCKVVLTDSCLLLFCRSDQACHSLQLTVMAARLPVFSLDMTARHLCHVVGMTQ